MSKEIYKGWLTKITTIDNKELFQVRIDKDPKGYFIIEINPETKESYIIKDRLNNETENNK